MPGRSGHWSRRTARITQSIGVGPQNSVRSGSTSPRRRVEVDLEPGDALALGVHLGLGLDLLRDEHARGRREPRVAVEALLVAQQLVDAGDLADALHLDHDRAAVAVAAQQVDRTDVGRDTRAERA